MDSNTVTHYQTSFKVERLNSEHSPLRTIQGIIHRWLLGKEEDRRLRRSGRKEFFHKCKFAGLHGTNSLVTTDTAFSDDFTAWAFSYTHNDFDLGGRRRWHVDVGVKESKGENVIATFYCRVSFSRSRYDTSGEHRPPLTNTPRFIQNIVSDQNGLRVYSGDNDFRLIDQPIPVSVGRGKELCDHIKSKSRRCVIVVFNPLGSEKVTKEANKMARALAGKSRVMVLDDDSELAEEINHYLVRDLRVPMCNFRIYYPLNPLSPRPVRHRWFDPLASDYQDKYEALVSSLLRDYYLKEAGSVTDISQIRRMVEMENRKREIEALSSLRDDARNDAKKTGEAYDLLMKSYDSMKKDYYSMCKKAEDEENRADKNEQDLNQWLTDYEPKQKEAQDVKDELYNAKEKIRALESGKAENREDGIDWPSELKRRVSNLQDIVDFFFRNYEKTLIVHDKAFDSADEFDKLRKNTDNRVILGIAWDILFHISTTLYELVIVEGVNDIEAEFKRRSGFEYAPTEGGQTKKDKSMRSRRQIKVNGKKYEIWPHVRYGRDFPTILRVYLEYERDEGKIIIGHVGDHMDTAGSKRNKKRK